MSYIDSLAERAGISGADVMATAIDVVVSGRSLPVVFRGTISVPAKLEAVAEETKRLELELHTLIPRLNVPMVAEDDPQYGLFCDWRTRCARILPLLTECVTEFEAIRAQMLPGLMLDQVRLGRVAAMWAERLSNIYIKLQTKAPELGRDNRSLDEFAGLQECWQMLYSIGLVHPTRELEANAKAGFPMTINRPPIAPSSEIHRADAVNAQPGRPEHVTFRARITKEHKRDLNRFRRLHGCKDKSTAVRLVLAQYQQLGGPIEVKTRTASLADLSRVALLARDISQRLHEVSSRLRARSNEAPGAKFVGQVEAWRDAADQLFARIRAVNFEIRCVTRAMGGLGNVSIEQCLPFLAHVWLKQMPRWLAGAEARLAALEGQRTGSANELDELRTALDSRSLWELLFALGVAPPVGGKG